MASHIRFPSIEQFRNTVHTVTHCAQWVGNDANGDPVYDTSKPLPKLQFRGTTKLHGTNAAIAQDVEGNVWCQSRSSVITPQSDNAGFAMFEHSNHSVFVTMLEQARLCKQISGEQSILIFGEWCGGSIQKGIGLTQLPKMFVIFGIARVEGEGECKWEWFSPDEIRIVYERTQDQASTFPSNLHHIYEFPTHLVEIDFARPQDIQQILIDLTIAVEDECPVAKQLGATPENGATIGEGIVWQCTTPKYENRGYWFKVKGERHKKKIKMKTPVDAERTDAINDLAIQVTPEWRLEQMLQETFNTLNGGLLDIKRMGDYIKAVIQDIVKEELDIVTASGFTMKEVSGSISKIARDHMLKQLEFRDPVG